jgi:uncharacterized protein YqgC (DUF456 family)
VFPILIGMTVTIVLWVLAVLLVIAGIAGTVLPALPGAVLVFAGLLLAAWADAFVRVGPLTLTGLGVLAALTYAVDFAATALGAKKLGASRRALIGAALGALVGLFFGIPGVLLGPFIGAVLGELSERRDLVRAGRAGVGAWLGLVLGAGAKLALVMAMLGVFAVSWWTGAAPAP